MNIRTKKNKKTRRANRTRARLLSSHRGRKIRLSVHRSINNIYAQIIDENGKVLASANSLQIPDDKRAKMTKKEEAAEVGKKIAEEALAEKIEKICFDRGRFRYHGRIESLATAARKAGLQF